MPALELPSLPLSRSADRQGGQGALRGGEARTRGATYRVGDHRAARHPRGRFAGDAVTTLLATEPEEGLLLLRRSLGQLDHIGNAEANQAATAQLAVNR